MIERTPWLNLATYVILISGLLMLLLPVWFMIVASTQTLQDVQAIPAKLMPGDQFLVNVKAVWQAGDFGTKFVNSLILATGVVAGKIVLASLTAFGIVFFDHRLRMPVFWLVFVTLMLPLEVRIIPTYAVAVNALSPFQWLFDVTGISWLIRQTTGIEVVLNWNLLNSYTGLIVPLVATATGTFLYRQFFLTIPDELVEAAKMDGAGPLRFLRDVLIPLSRTNMAALATIMFVVGWNQYLWPLLITTDPAYGTAAVELGRIVPDQYTTGGDAPNWHWAMAGTLLVMLPPVIVVILMQRWFVRGLINTDK